MEHLKEQIERKIEQLKSQLTGNLIKDGTIHQDIYQLKKLLNPRIEEHPEEDTDDSCLNCGS